MKLNGITSTAAGATLKSFITHPGRSTLRDADGNFLDFTHYDRRTVCEYDIVTNAVKTQVGVS